MCCDISNTFFLLLCSVSLYRYTLVWNDSDLQWLLINPLQILTYITSCEHKIPFSLGKCLRIVGLGHMLSVCLSYKKLPNWFEKWLHHFEFLQAIYGSFSCSTHLPAICALSCFVCFISALLIAVLWYHIAVFNLHFPNN